MPLAVDLTRLGVALRARRPRAAAGPPYSLWCAPGEGRAYHFVWFRTRGCTFDLGGQCTMCDYGTSTEQSPDEMVSAVRAALAQLSPVPRVLLVSPSGSIFDDREVAPAARRAIFGLVRGVRCRLYICETRPEFVSEDKLREFRQILDDRPVAIEMGLESSDPWVLRHCVNKSMRLEQYLSALALARGNRIRTYANVLLGAPFLSETEAIDDAERTVRWALDVGTDRCVLFPVHVKPWTIVHRVWERALYSPPSLWSLVEVLRRLGPGLARRVNVSWYRPQSGSGLGSVGGRVGWSPTTCPRCEPEVLRLLDRYRRSRRFVFVEAIARLDCSCRVEWRKRLERPALGSPAERIEQFLSATASESQRSLGIADRPRERLVALKAKRQLARARHPGPR